MKKIIIPVLIILMAAVMRFLPHLPNMTPIAAMALFGGAYFNKKYALLVPILVMFLSDIFLGFHNTMAFVYGSFLLTGVIGIILKKHNNFKWIIGGTLLSSVLFFLITNFGVWAVSGMYVKNLLGLQQCLVMALPFFRNNLIGDFFYSGMFFGGYEILLKYGKKIAAKA